MTDFLTFKTFITPDILIFFYYLGAVGIPIVLFIGRHYLKNRFIPIQKFDNLLSNSFSRMSQKQQFYTLITSVFLFLFMEIFWRMFFEMVIAYFQMHDALLHLSH